MRKRGLGNRRREHRQSESSDSGFLGQTAKAPKAKILWTLLTRKNDMIAKLKSRKLWAAVVGSVIVALGQQLGLSPDIIQWVGTIVTGYIVGQGIADAGAGGGSQVG